MGSSGIYWGLVERRSDGFQWGGIHYHELETGRSQELLSLNLLRYPPETFTVAPDEGFLLLAMKEDGMWGTDIMLVENFR